MEPREIHEQMMKLLTEVYHAEMPEDSRIVIRGYIIKIVRELHNVVLEKIQETDIEDEFKKSP
jgi:hypothetical protein